MTGKPSVCDLHDSDSIVVEDSGDVFGGKFVGGVADKQARFSDGTVADDHASSEERTIVSRYPQVYGKGTAYLIVATTMVTERPLLVIVPGGCGSRLWRIHLFANENAVCRV